MTESSEPRIESESAISAQSRQPSGVGQLAAWVGIVAGVIFVIAVVFFSGFYAGSHWNQTYRDGQWPPGCMMAPGGMMGPGQQPSTAVTPNPGNRHHP
ncbi:MULTISPECIES: hypothetical protein [Mycolicibacterium]|uniref:hypothetical protein n=1 Tax=Mycolicibacterium TaxID=1866885 RepID=UPI00148FFAE1|nr:hypothetical protein [Mycolicibacterium fortuitum]